MSNSKLLASRPKTPQVIVLGCLAIAISLVLYSDSFRSCCMLASWDYFTVVLLPALVIHLALAGGNIHGGAPLPELRLAIGLTVEFYLLLWLSRWLLLCLRNQHKLKGGHGD